MPWFSLCIAVVVEILATNLLPSTRRFTRLLPTIVVCSMYLVTVAFLAHAVTEIDVAVVYTLWSALGILVIAGVGIVFRRERVSTTGWIGLLLIIAGIIVINVGG